MARGNVANVAEQIASEPPPERELRSPSPDELFPTGSALMNLCCSDHVTGGFQLGSIVTMPGSSSAGKTMQAVTAMAEGIYDPRFDGYDFVFDDAEETLNFDLPYLFGEKVGGNPDNGTTGRLVKPSLGCSNTVQLFQHNIMTLTKKDRPVIYCLDSLDSLSSDEELEKELRKALAMAKSKEAADKIAGSYGTEKAKILGQTLRMINNELKRTNSLLIILQQVRQKIGATAFESPWITSGGQAPFFYSFHQIWLNKMNPYKIKGLPVGAKVKAKVKKNKFNGKLRECTYDIYYDYGVDDVGSMVDFLLELKIWKKGTKSVINAGDLMVGLEGTRPSTTGEAGTLVRQIEDNDLIPEFKKLVEYYWQEREESVRLRRRPRF